MAVVAPCIVTRSEEGMGAFGVRADNDENVYFPYSIAESVALEEFDEVEAILVRNDRDEPRWKAIRVRRPAGENEADDDAD
jgi:hypothetical protein